MKLFKASIITQIINPTGMGFEPMYSRLRNCVFQTHAIPDLATLPSLLYSSNIKNISATFVKPLHRQYQLIINISYFIENLDESTVRKFLESRKNDNSYRMLAPAATR